MVYRDVFTMLVRDMQTDVVPMRQVKLKCSVFEEISCLLVGDLTLLCFTTFFYLS